MKDLASVRILVADPNEILVEDYQRHLEACGAVVATAKDGLECVELLRDFRPDVLVLEPELLWGGGPGVLERMLSEPDVPIAPVVVVTSARDLEQLREIIKFPLYDLAVKPLTPEQLATKIRWVVDNALKLGKVGWPRIP